MPRRIPESAYTNPEVRFERSDIESKGVVYFAITLGLSVLFVVATMLWFGNVLLREHRKPDPLNLPEASVDADRLPPRPRLEAIDDVREGRVRLYPPRARDYLRPQQRLLEDGGKDTLPIKTAMDTLTRSLPVRKSGATEPPVNFQIRLPTKASSGRTTTGGQ